MSRRSVEDLAYERLDDDMYGDEGSEEAVRGPLILALAFAVLLVFAAIVWNTYRQGVKASPGDLPVIAGSEIPYKRIASGARAEAEDLSRRIYDQIDGSDREDEVEPRSIATMRVEESSTEREPPRDLRPSIPNLGPNAFSQPDLPTEALEPEILAGGRAESVPPEPVERAEPVERSEPVAPRAVVPPAPSGSFLVQLVAMRTEAAAENAWQDLSAKHPMLLEGLNKEIQRADLGQQGTYYRLRVGAFEERAQAANLCTSMQARGQACMVVGR